MLRQGLRLRVKLRGSEGYPAKELKPLYKIQWWDEKDCGKGFEYLYLTKEDYESLPAGTVEAVDCEPQ